MLTPSKPEGTRQKFKSPFVKEHKLLTGSRYLESRGRIGVVRALSRGIPMITLPVTDNFNS